MGASQKIYHRPSTPRNHFPYLFVAISLIAGSIFFGISGLKTPSTENSLSESQLSETENTKIFIESSNNISLDQSKPVSLEISETAIDENPKTELFWESVKIKSGDNLALIFKRKRLSPQMLYNIMALGGETSILRNLKPGKEIRFLFEDGQFEALQYDIDLTDTLYIRKLGDIYSAKLLEKELETKVKTASGTIQDSLFLAGRSAGLSDHMIMQMINLYSWDIDFAMEVRQKDQFHIIYEEHYIEGEKVQDGPILAAEFINQGKSFKSVRYTHADGHADYYAENGNSMRKAFIRTPVKFARISSRFNLRRKHPVLNKIRAHKGVDYAATTGTPIRATGDGIVKLASRKGGYGKAIIIQHGGKYTTLYGHLSRYARGMKRGKHIKQGQIIGYVGKTGLATGPHLHYEFRVNGVHRNPLTVKLPKAMRIPEAIMGDFLSQTSILLTQLNELTTAVQIANTASAQPIVAFNETESVRPEP